jgi:hypothetical protein
MRAARTVFHVAIMLVGFHCVPLGAMFVAMMGLTLMAPEEVARYHLVGPPEVLQAARWVPVAALATAVCGAGAAIIAFGFLSGASARRRPGK